MRMPSKNETAAISQKVRCCCASKNQTMRATRRPPARYDDVPAGQGDRLAAHAAGKLQERDHRPVKVTARWRRRATFRSGSGREWRPRADVEGRGRVERAGGDQHRGHADQRVKGGDELRHRCHRHATRDHGARAATIATATITSPRRRVRRRVPRRAWWRPRSPCRSCRTGCLAGWWSDAKGTQRQDEEDSGDQIGQRGEIGAHVTSASVGTY